VTGVNTLEVNAILRSDFHSFAQKCFVELNSGARWKDNWHLDAISRALEGVIHGATTRLIINMPPRSLKSLLGAVALPAYLLGKDPAKKIICASYSQELAEKHAGDFRRVIDAKWYANLFGRQPLLKNAGNEVVTAAGGFRLANSVGGTLTGRGGDLIIVDDPLNASEANSKTTRDRTNEWFSQTLVSRLDDKLTSAIVIIMQRLHAEDLTGYVQERGAWDVLSLPAVTSEDRTVPLLNGRAHVWKAGEALHPLREPLDILHRVSNDLGSYGFSAQYLQTPVPDTGNMLKREWLREHATAPIKSDGDQVVQSWDTAMKATDGSDFSVCLTFLVRNNNQFFLTDVCRERVEFPDLVKIVAPHARKHEADAILIEDAVSGTSLIQYARQAGLQGIIPIKPTTDKASRMMVGTPKLESGSLSLPKDAPWLVEFLKEYLAFPKARHDDQMDALSQFLQWVKSREDFVFEADFGHDDDYYRRVNAVF
jgi:predicted phage terminase large subunit-like protein